MEERWKRLQALKPYTIKASECFAKAVIEEIRKEHPWAKEYYCEFVPIPIPLSLRVMVPKVKLLEYKPQGVLNG